MTRWIKRILRPLVVRIAWDLTTHDGFYTPCDDDWHCAEVRRKARRYGSPLTHQRDGMSPDLPSPTEGGS